MEFNFLDLTGLKAFLSQLKSLFATKKEVDTVEQDTNDYILNIDYSQLKFDTTEIISEEEVVS